MVEAMTIEEQRRYYTRLACAHSGRGNTAKAAEMRAKLAALGPDDEGAAPLGRALAAAAAAPSAPAASSEHVPIIILAAEAETDREERPEIVPMANHAPEGGLIYCPMCIIESDEEGKTSAHSIGNPSAAVPSEPEYQPIAIVVTGGDE